MAAAGIRPGTEGLLGVASKWDAEIRLPAFEEGTIHPDIGRVGNVGEGGVGDTIYCRFLPSPTVRALASTDQAGPEALTYETGSLTRAAGVPVGRYCVVEVPIHMRVKLNAPDQSQLRAGYRSLLRNGHDETMDAYAASTLSALASTIKGPGNLDKAALLDIRKTIRTNAKSHAKNNSTIHFKYHPSQTANVLNVAEIANANLRGGADNPNITGVILEAWGMTFAETGNIFFNGGNYWNMAFLGTAFGKGFNFEPTVMPIESTGLVDRISSYGEYAFMELYDADHLVYKSA